LRIISDILPKSILDSFSILVDDTYIYVMMKKKYTDFSYFGSDTCYKFENFKALLSYIEKRKEHIENINQCKIGRGRCIFFNINK